MSRTAASAIVVVVFVSAVPAGFACAQETAIARGAQTTLVQTARVPAPSPLPPAAQPTTGTSAVGQPANAPPPAAPPDAHGAGQSSPPALPGSHSPGGLGKPVPARSPTAQVHLHRPGTDVDGDVLTGNLGGDVFVLKGNVTLQSDPKIDRAVAQESESDDPLTVTADEIDIDRLGLSYVAKGHVHFSQGQRSGSADLAMLNEGAHTLDLIGNADVRQGDRRAVAAKMHYNTVDKQFAGAGNVRIYQPVPTPNPKPSSSATTKRKRRLPF